MEDRQGNKYKFSIREFQNFANASPYNQNQLDPVIGKINGADFKLSDAKSISIPQQGPEELLNALYTVGRKAYGKYPENTNNRSSKIEKKVIQFYDPSYKSTPAGDQLDLATRQINNVDLKTVLNQHIPTGSHGFVNGLRDRYRISPSALIYRDMVLEPDNAESSSNHFKPAKASTEAEILNTTIPGFENKHNILDSLQQVSLESLLFNLNKIHLGDSSVITKVDEKGLENRNTF